MSPHRKRTKTLGDGRGESSQPRRLKTSANTHFGSPFTIRSMLTVMPRVISCAAGRCSVGLIHGCRTIFRSSVFRARSNYRDGGRLFAAAQTQSGMTRLRLDTITASTWVAERAW
jgi:hypothetical protein